MATPAENLQTVYENVCKQLAEITENPKPSYMIDGQSVQWTAYLRMLTDQLETIKAAMAAETPWEVHSQGYT